MPFLFILGLIVFTQIIFTQSFFSDASIMLQTIGWIQLVVFLFSFLKRFKKAVSGYTNRFLIKFNRYVRDLL